MIRPGAGMPPSLRHEIQRIAQDVARRRRALGLTQTQLDFEAGYTLRTTDTIERKIIDRRCLLPSDPRVLQVLATLDRIEKDPACRQKYEPRTPHPRALRAKSRSRSSRGPQVLTATLKLCPDMEVWITQGGCDGIRKTHSICTARRFGLGCKGVSHRRRLERKEISVEYTPPKPGADSPNKLRAEDWT